MRRSCLITSRPCCSEQVFSGSGGSASTPGALSLPVPIAGLAFVTTMLAPAATLVVWTFLDMMRSGKPTAVGCATAIVVGLVAITPAAGFVSPMSAILLGGIAAVPSYLALIIRSKTSLDDSLDVVAAHGVGGTVGAILTGVFADKALNGVFDGALHGNPGSGRHPGSGCADGNRVQRRHEFHPAQGDFSVHPASSHCGRRGDRPRRDDARRGSVSARH